MTNNTYSNYDRLPIHLALSATNVIHASRIVSRERNVINSETFGKW